VSAPLSNGFVPGGFAAPPPPPRTLAPGRQPQASGIAAAPPKPTAVRAQMDDDMPPPPPEQLGVAGVRKGESAVDWDLVHRRFREAGATCVQFDHPSQGGCRLVCLLPTAHSDRTHRIEAEAATEAEVARLALSQLEEWTRKK